MGKADKYSYGVVFDAGSSGTRVYVYRWLKNEIARQGDRELLKTLPDLDTKDKWTKKVHPGVSSFGETPELIGPDHLKGLLEHALEYVPKDVVSDTPIFLLATAGMRLLPEYQRDALLKNICSYIKTETNFFISDCDQHIQVITGETESLYGWIAANYLLGGFDAPQEHDHGKGHHTYGFLDMGGASAQIAFAPNATEAEKHANDLKLVRFRAIDGNIQEHRVFVSTWLGFGVNEARKRYVQALLDAYKTSTSSEFPDPCLPTGIKMTLDAQVISPTSSLFSEPHLIGTGQFRECLRRTYPLLEKDMPCLDEPCLINGQHVPAIDFDVNHFVGISEYWHTTHEIFEMAHKDKSYDFHTYQSRVKEFCERPWSETQAEVAEKVYGKKVNEQTAYEVCFKASWLINILHDGIGVPRVGLEQTSSGHNGTKAVIENAKAKGYIDPFQAVNKIKDKEVSWTMGKIALYASADIPPAENTDSYPVGFGSNEPGVPVPADFQYPGGGRLQSTSDFDFESPASVPSGSQSLTDRISAPFVKSDSSHRIPGFVFFLLIIVIALFYLCGRERRTRFLYRYLPYYHPSPTIKKPYISHHNSGSNSSSISSILSRILPRSRSSIDHDRSLEDGSSARLYDPSDFELGDVNGNDYYSDENSDLPQFSSSATDAGSHPTKRSNTPKLKTSNSHLSMTSVSAGAVISERLKPMDVMDRRGLAVRTASRERLHVHPGTGHRSRSRSGSQSPSRLRIGDSGGSGGG